jgi:hypothetical protein
MRCADLTFWLLLLMPCLFIGLPLDDDTDEKPLVGYGRLQKFFDLLGAIAIYSLGSAGAKLLTAVWEQRNPEMCGRVYKLLPLLVAFVAAGLLALC